MYLGLKKCHLVIHIGIIFSVLFFYSTLSICIYHWVSKVYTRVRIYSCQDPLDISIWLTCHLLCSRSFPLQGYLQHPICRLCLFFFFLFLLANKTVLSGSLCFRGARGVCLDWVPLCIAVVPQCPLILCTQVASSTKHTRISTSQFQPPCEPASRFFLRASPCPTVMHPSNSHSDFNMAMPHRGIPLICQFSIPLRPGHWTPPMSQ